jgi:uncharacterized protein YndB with AHSA1/START domain
MSFTHTHRATLAATPAQVFAAFTVARQLSHWFAEHVDVATEVGGPYRFWGRHTLDTPTAEQATQQVTQVEPDVMLGFRWEIGGVPTNVTITLAAEGATTKAVLQHAVEGELDRTRARELIDDHWRLAFGNLAAHLAGGGGVVLPDYGDPQPVVRVERTIDAPRRVVFRALTEPALINQWFGSKAAVVEPRTGGQYNLHWKYEIDGRPVDGGPTRILDFAQDERLVLDWPDWRGDASVTGQSISFTLEDAGDGGAGATRLHFLHAGFGRTADLSDFPFGWDWFLGELARVAGETARGT